MKNKLLILLLSLSSNAWADVSDSISKGIGTALAFGLIAAVFAGIKFFIHLLREKDQTKNNLVNAKDKILHRISTDFKSDKKFFVRAIVIFIFIIFFYYLFSPYQHCMRSEDDSYWCLKNTRW